MPERTHIVTIEVAGNYPHGSKQFVKITIAGDGSLEHMFEAFKATLVATGFSRSSC